MNLVIFGSRKLPINEREALTVINRTVRDNGLAVTRVISGGAQGADAYGEEWARRRGIPVTVMPAEWSTHGKSAGMIRNEKMVQVANAGIALWDGRSKGTAHMITLMKRWGLDLYIETFKYETPADGQLSLF